MLVTLSLLIFFTLSDGRICRPNRIHASRVVVRGDSGYSSAIEQYASKTVNVTTIQPALVVYCSTEREVQDAISYAADCNYTISTRSGGHSYTGCSSCGDYCMQIDVTGINMIEVNGIRVNGCLQNPKLCPSSPPKTMSKKLVTIGSGVELGELDKILNFYGLSIPHGGCRSVRAGGHFQSSAWGHLAVSHGSGMDRVVSFRIVLPNGSVVTASKNDRDNTLYWSVLGSAPGSWGVVISYTIDAIHYSEVPHSRVMVRSYLYSGDVFMKVLMHTQRMLQLAEQKDTRDLKFLLYVGPRADDFVDMRTKLVVDVIWMGIDEGPWTDALYNQIMKPYDEAGTLLKSPRDYINLSAPLFNIISLASVDFINPGYNFHFQSFHSDRWWDESFYQAMVVEIDRRLKVPNSFVSFQFLPLGRNSQWAKNEGLNALTWRDVRMYVDDWWMYKDDFRAESIRSSMESFRERTFNYWKNSDGTDRHSWMSPMTTIPGSTDLRNAEVRKAFFPNTTVFRQLQDLKRKLDPDHLFADQSTIPL